MNVIPTSLVMPQKSPKTESDIDDDNELKEIQAFLDQIVPFFTRSEAILDKLFSRHGEEIFDGTGIHYPWPGHTTVFAEALRAAVRVARKAGGLSRFHVFCYRRGMIELSIEANDPSAEIEAKLGAIAEEAAQKSGKICALCGKPARRSKRMPYHDSCSRYAARKYIRTMSSITHMSIIDGVAKHSKYT